MKNSLCLSLACLKGIKNTLLYFLILITVFSCKKDSFSDTDKYFVTDKDAYEIGDNFLLTVFISPENEEKTIRFYKTYSNLRIYFSLINNKKGIDSKNTLQLKKYFIEGSSIFGSDEKFITDYRISKQEPFKQEFKGKIFQLKSKIIIEIPELNVKNVFYKSEFDEFSEISIRGYCKPINPKNGESESYFISKNIKVLIE